jgi:hypothetical protein
MNTAYENLIRQIAGARLTWNNAPDTFDIKEAIVRDEQRQRLQREIAALEKKVQNEKQFNRQVALKDKLKRPHVELGGIANG